VELVFDFGKVTIGDKKAFRRICGKQWTGYEWSNLGRAPEEDHAAIYFVVMRQNEPVSETDLDEIDNDGINEVFNALAAKFKDSEEPPEADPTAPGTSS
jgi:hypothetical protein